MSEVWYTARSAARYLGYTVGELPTRQEKGLRCFYQMARRTHLPAYGFGRALRFKQSDLDAALQRKAAPATDSFDRIGQQAIADARSAGTLRVVGGRR